MDGSEGTIEVKVVEERDGAGRLRRRWLHDRNGRIVEAPSKNNSTTTTKTTNVINNDNTNNTIVYHRHWSVSRMRHILYDAFLPVGYPDSVTPDYLGYQTYDSLQAFFSTITSLLANRAILQGLGVGDASSSATYALLMTILKDGISRVATIAFAYRFGLAIEPECKRYRFLADIFNDSAFFLDLFSPSLSSSSLFVSYFFFFPGAAKVAALVLAEALRAMCGVAAGASKAALSKHFARRRNNLAELNAKESSQETAVGLFGLLAGSVVVRHVESRDAVFALMVLLVFVHLAMNYLGVRCVQLDVLNQQRATILFDHYLRSSGEVLSPAEVARRESIVFWSPVVRSPRGNGGYVKISFAAGYDVMATAARVLPAAGGVRGDNVIATDATDFRLCVCDDYSRVKIVLFGDPLRLPPGDTTAVRAWFAAMQLLYSSADIKTSSAAELIPEMADKGREMVGALEAAGWNVAESNLDSMAPWMMVHAEQKKEL